MKISAKELVENTGLGYAAANGILKKMAENDVATITKRPQPSGRGKPTNVYQVSNYFLNGLKELLTVPQSTESLTESDDQPAI